MLLEKLLGGGASEPPLFVSGGCISSSQLSKSSFPDFNVMVFSFRVFSSQGDSLWTPTLDLNGAG